MTIGSRPDDTPDEEPGGRRVPNAAAGAVAAVVLAGLLALAFA
jgi:hypothetical protein